MKEITLSRPSEIAEMFGQSISWVSKHYKELGGEKIGGRIFFPSKEVIYERLFCEKQGVAVRGGPGCSDRLAAKIRWKAFMVFGSSAKSVGSRQVH